MQLFEFSSHGFRNLSPDPVSFGAGVTLVTGENAQGKTNLLEAVALLCAQRSFRGAGSADMASDGEHFSIAGISRNRRGEDRITASWSREEGRQFTLGGKSAGFREISERAPAVFLAPEHRELITGPPAVRRRFLDRLVLGLKPAAGDDLARYGAALRERNALLARAKMGRAAAGAAELEAWTEELCLVGSAVRSHRGDALAAWDEEFRALAGEAGGDYAGIRVTYAGNGESADEMRRTCQRLASLERRRGYSLAGPHRDELFWSRRGRRLSAEASAGEIARTVALARLAEWRSLAKATGELPLFGADDFDAGLSEAWSEDFFEALPGEAAVLLTSTAPVARWSGRVAAVVEMRRGLAAAPRPLRAVAAIQGVR